MTDDHRGKLTTWVLFGGLMAATLVLMTACGGGNNGAGPSSTIPDTSTSATSEATSTSTPSTTSTSASSIASTEPADTDGRIVEVYFSTVDESDCGAVRPFKRTVIDDADVHRSTFQHLVGGPSGEEVADDVSSFFSSDTAGSIISAVLTDGLLVVDFTDYRSVIPNASTSCGSEALLAQLNSTAFQFDNVERTRYLIEGSCDDFANWLQRGCFDTDRTGRQVDVPLNERAIGSGCTPLSTDTLPTGRWFGFVQEAQAEQLTFDLACWFTGEAAAEAASEDGEESPPPNNFYIRNESDALRVHPVDSATTVEWLPDPGDPASAEVVTYEDWLVGRPRPYDPGVWITTTDDSHVIKIEEQYVP